MNQVVVKGESVYQCDVCSRKVRVPANRYGLDVLQHCNITQNCKGTLHRVILKKDIYDTPAFAPEVQGLTDWFQRKVLYTHTQTIDSLKWTVRHGLGNNPVLHTFINQQTSDGTVLVQIDPDAVKVLDRDTIELTFTKPYSGTVQCVSLSSANVVNPTSTDTAVKAIQPLQLTNNSADITIATLTAQNVVTITITYQASGGVDPVQVDYANVAVSPSLSSPWVGVRRVVVNGKRYVVRSFNLQTTANGAVAFEAGLVPNGSTFKITAIDGIPVAQYDALILCANSPFAAVDRIYDQYIDAGTISSTDPEMYIDKGKGFCRRSAVRDVYPAILVV